MEFDTKMRFLCRAEFGAKCKVIGVGLVMGLLRWAVAKQGRARGDICPLAQHFGAPNWGRNVLNKLQNVECQRMLITAICKMSNVIAKSHQDHQASQSKQL